ncbi:MAG: hypothetical protein ACFFD5_06550 [Candidatus Thorarchaeota archaeon]
MRNISDIDSKELGFWSFLKKGYAKIFTFSIILLIAGIILLMIPDFIPEVESSDPGYEDYLLLILRLSVLSSVLQNAGLAFFSLSTFLGAIIETKELKRALIISSSMGLIALIVIFTNFFLLIRFS